MPLTVEIKSGERFILGGYVITSAHKARLVFHNQDVPLLREREILAPEAADTLAKRIYLLVQDMYLSKDREGHQEAYDRLVMDILQVAPSIRPYTEIINDHLAAGEIYKALRATKNLISHEELLVKRARTGDPALSPTAG